MSGISSQLASTTSAADAAGASGSDHGRRLSPLDGSFLRLESPQSHMHVGFSAVFAAPSGRARPTVEALRERAAGRLHEVPWCRWRLDRAPWGLSEPRWIDDARFDLAAHIVALTELDDPVGHSGFEALRSTVLSVPLDRSRPLWQIFLVPRLEDGRVGMVGKIHHALVADVGSARRGLSWMRVDGRRCDREQRTRHEGDGPRPRDEVWRAHVPTLRQPHCALPLTA